MVGKSAVEEWARAPPPSLPVGVRIARCFYDPEDKSVLGRTPKRWAIAITFYLCFYAVLAVLWSICFAGLMYKIDDKKPMWMLEESLIGANPGLAFRPRNIDGSVIRYDMGNMSDSRLQMNIEQLETFTKDYKNALWFTSKTECSSSDNYGFPDTPCFYIKLNKIYNWKPQYFDGSSNTFPDDFPTDLQEFVSSNVNKQQVWISCQEEKSNKTLIEYPWGRGLSGSFFPFINERGYLSPFLAVKVTPPPNTEVTIRCRAWAKNIIYNKSLKEPSGYTRFQLYIENHFTEDTTG